MNQRSSVPPAEQLATGLPLAVVGGFLDTYTYLTRGGVFANAQTGNMVLLGIAAARGQWLRAGQYLIPILAFTLGVMVTEGLRARGEGTGKGGGWWRPTVLALEAVLLAVVGLLPAELPNLPVNAIVSFLCSMQVNGFRLLEGLPYATTMCTGNLRSCSHHLWRRLFGGEKEEGKKAARYLYVMLAFCGGAAAGVPAVLLFGSRSVWGCAAVLAGLWLRLDREERRLRHDG